MIFHSSVKEGVHLKWVSVVRPRLGSWGAKSVEPSGLTLAGSVVHLIHAFPPGNVFMHISCEQYATDGCVQLWLRKAAQLTINGQRANNFGCLMFALSCCNSVYQ